MAHEGQAAGLYDFLYKDSHRLASFYAQIFNGRLTSREESVSSKDAVERGTHGGLKAAIMGIGGESGAATKTTAETTASAKHTIDPHDIITTDILTELVEKGWARKSLSDAGHGDLVLCQGTLAFIDKTVIELASASLGAAAGLGEAKSKGQRQQQDKAVTAFRMMMEKFALPSSFWLRTKDTLQVVGTLKEEGMSEPISSYYFKHGAFGLSDVYLIGIKEMHSGLKAPSTQLIGAGQQLADGLSSMLFPPEAIRVTPVAMFRELSRSSATV